MYRFLLVLTVLMMAATVNAADTAPAPKTEKLVTVQASDKPVREVIKNIADATGETILIEKIVEGRVTMTLKDVNAEKVLDSIAEALHIQWRKIYVESSSAMAKDGDALASQMRTVIALKFPEMIVCGVGSGSPVMHAQNKTTVSELTKALPQSAGLKAVYLITDDAKAKKKEVDETSKKAIAKYNEMYKQLLDMFLAMSPEERNAVMQESMGLSMGMMQQLGPDGLRDMLTSIYESNPQYMTDMNKIGMQAIFDMSPETRRMILRSSVRQQMELMNSLTPEQMQELQQEAAAAAAEVMGENGQNNQ